STVELSGLAQFMASLSRAQKKLIEMQSSSSGSPQDPNPNFGTLNNTTQTVIDAFNALQTAALGKAGQSSDAAAGAALAKQFAAALQQQAADNSAATGLGTLSQIGIGFPAAPAANAPAPLSVDAAALRSAFNTNPAATLALVTQAADTLGTLGTGLAQQIGAAAAAAAPPDVNGAAPGVGASAVPLEAAVPQSTLTDMALSDLLAENLSQAQTAAPAAQPSPVPAPAIAVVTGAAQAAATQTTQAEQATQAKQAT
ncbi:MAG TPA: hypothetical protein DCW29_04010, partial [Janthinobacterium sp.]|nr:hypothetical protein [Janthinobacterium sp.]